MKRKEIQAVKMVARFEADADMVKQLRGRGDGVFEARWGYFYRHGKTPATFVAKVKKAFGTGVVILANGDHFAAWPASSYFWVRFKAWGKVPERAVALLEGLFADWDTTWEDNWTETRDYFADNCR